MGWKLRDPIPRQSYPSLPAPPPGARPSWDGGAHPIANNAQMRKESIADARSRGLIVGARRKGGCHIMVDEMRSGVAMSAALGAAVAGLAVAGVRRILIISSISSHKKTV